MIKKKLNIDEILRYHSEGFKPSCIAKKLDTHPLRIKTELTQLSLNYNKHVPKKKDNNHLVNDIIEMYKDGYSKKQICKNLKTYFSVVSSTLSKYNVLRYTPKNGYKICCNCKEEKEVINFGVCKRTKDNLRHSCKECRNKNETYNSEYHKKYREENKESKSKSDKEYRDNNKDKIKEYRKTERHKAVKSRSDKKYYLKIKSDPKKIMAARLRSQISECVSNKTFKTFDFLEYNSNDLVFHLESKFTHEMSWTNYGRGGWHIDHIKPIAAFEKDNINWVKEAFSLNNLQPLMESENCSKGSLYNGIRHFNKNIE